MVCGQQSPGEAAIEAPRQQTPTPPSKVLPHPPEELVAHLPLGRLCPILGLRKQLRLDPDALVGGAFRVELRPPDRMSRR